MSAPQAPEQGAQPEGGDAEGAARLDVWLWRARFFKTRALAAKAAAQGLRVNGQRTQKAGARVRPGDVLTFAQGAQVRVIEIAAIGARRGPAPEAQALYRDRAPPEAQNRPEARVGARPTGRDRRRADSLRADSLRDATLRGSDT